MRSLGFAIDAGRDRLPAMMSVAQNRLVGEEAASRHWSRGDKALASLRLAVARPLTVGDQTGADRLALTGQLLESGWSPSALLVELGLAPSLAKAGYRPDQLRISAGQPRGGEWTHYRHAASARDPYSGAFDVAGRDDLHTVQSYLYGQPVKYGTPGSVRVDVGGPTREKPDIVYDLKTGGASLTEARRRQLQTHLPKLDNGQDVEIHEIRP